MKLGRGKDDGEGLKYPKQIFASGREFLDCTCSHAAGKYRYAVYTVYTVQQQIRKGCEEDKNSAWTDFFPLEPCSDVKKAFSTHFETLFLAGIVALNLQARQSGRCTTGK